MIRAHIWETLWSHHVEIIKTLKSSDLEAEISTTSFSPVFHQKSGGTKKVVIENFSTTSVSPVFTGGTKILNRYNFSATSFLVKHWWY